MAQNAIRRGLMGLVGETPLVRLNKLSDKTGCEILAKAEFCSGAGSVKDRAAKYLILDAVEKGTLKPGGTIVEGTGGNTGIGLAHMCLAMGYKCVIFIPDSISMEKIEAMKLLGADVRPCPDVPSTDPLNFCNQAKHYAEITENCAYMDQFHNTANRMGHYKTTGPEIWRQTDGKLDAVVCAAGTGGTIAGVGMYLKEKNPKIQIILADPLGSVLYNWVKRGELVPMGEGKTIAEGIGKTYIPGNLVGVPLDDALHITDMEAIEMVYQLLHEEGLLVGTSSGLNVAAAVKVAQDLGPGHTIVTLLCDNGQNYMKKIFSREALESKGLLEAVPEKYRVSLH